MEKVRIGLIGCGRIAKNHLDAVSQIPDAEFVAVCDTIPAKAELVAEERGITKVYTDHHEMLAKEELDLVSICTPSGMHPEHGVDVANAGVHVLTEKPMAINIAAADRLIKACDDNHVHLFVVKQNRLNSTMQLLKRAVDKNRFGRIYMAQANVFWQRPQAYYDQE
ncbi:MAG: Gfo/Idh/MocA family oxidoreductase, partial [Candidatus Cloacimonetes bacterium]|nr:Gfo/Idh/MocA family oxidoreductase [Candidatus Cloacimonadota bacterium]